MSDVVVLGGGSSKLPPLPPEVVAANNSFTGAKSSNTQPEDAAGTAESKSELEVALEVPTNNDTTPSPNDGGNDSSNDADKSAPPTSPPPPQQPSSSSSSADEEKALESNSVSEDALPDSLQIQNFQIPVTRSSAVSQQIAYAEKKLGPDIPIKEEQQKRKRKKSDVPKILRNMPSGLFQKFGAADNGVKKFRRFRRRQERKEKEKRKKQEEENANQAKQQPTATNNGSFTAASTMPTASSHTTTDAMNTEDPPLPFRKASRTLFNAEYYHAPGHVPMLSTTNVYVGGIPRFYSEQDLRGVFGKYGKIVSIYITKAQTVAFVQYEKHLDAKRAIDEETNRVPPNGKWPWHVKFANYNNLVQQRQSQREALEQTVGEGGLQTMDENDMEMSAAYTQQLDQQQYEQQQQQQQHGGGGNAPYGQQHQQQHGYGGGDFRDVRSR